MVQNEIIRALLPFLPRLSAGPLKVLVALCAAINGDSATVDVSTAEISVLTDLNRRTVFSALATLVELGLILKQRSEISGPNRYMITAMNSTDPERPCNSGSPGSADIPAPESTEAAEVPFEEPLDPEDVPEYGGPTSEQGPPENLEIHGDQAAGLAEVAAIEPSDLECLEALLGRRPDEGLLDRLNQLPNASTARVSSAIRRLVARGHWFRRDTLLSGAVAYALRAH